MQCVDWLVLFHCCFISVLKKQYLCIGVLENTEIYLSVISLGSVVCSLLARVLEKKPLTFVYMKTFLHFRSLSLYLLSVKTIGLHFPFFSPYFSTFHNNNQRYQTTIVISTANI